MVPVDDKTGFNYIINEVEDLKKILPYCRDFRTCIQAGGNIGIWPVALARKFKRVVTVEPDAANYLAMTKNINAFPNIEHQRAAFGMDFGTGSIYVNQEGNVGALQVKDGSDFKIITIDSLNIEDCDLLQLDVEGYEYFALAGAVKTITKCKPIIVLELNGLGEKFGYTNGAVIDLVTKLGYEQTGVVRHDYIFVPVGKEF